MTTVSVFAEYDKSMLAALDTYLLNIILDDKTPFFTRNSKLKMLADSNPLYKDKIMDFTKGIYDKTIKKRDDNVIITVYLNNDKFEIFERTMNPKEDKETGHVVWSYDGNEYTSTHVIPIELPLWTKWVIELCEKCGFTKSKWNATSSWHDDFGEYNKYYDDKAVNIVMFK
jgi:hypothetical protein